MAGDFRIAKNLHSQDGVYQAEQFTAGGAIEAGDMLIWSGSEDKLIKATNNPTSETVAAIAESPAAADGDTFEAVPLHDGLIIEGTATAAGDVNNIGSFLGIDVTSGVQTFEFEGNLMFQIYKIIDATARTIQCRYVGVGGDQTT